MIQYTDKEGNQRTHPGLRLDDAQILPQYKQQVIATMAQLLEIVTGEVVALGGSPTETTDTHKLLARTEEINSYEGLLAHARVIQARVERLKQERQQLLLSGGVDTINELVRVAIATTGANFGGYRIETTRHAS